MKILYNGQAIITQENIAQKLRQKHKIFPKLIGISNGSKSNKQFLDLPYLIDKYSVAYLLENSLVKIQELQPTIQNQLNNVKQTIQYKVYCYLKTQFYLVDGHKFGCTYLAYEKDPSNFHAKYIIFVQKNKKQSINYNEYTRLSEICKKQCLYCYQNDKEEIICQKLERKKEQYIRKDNLSQKQIKEKKVLKYISKEIKFKEKLNQKN